jgi:hypothetical protein
MHGNEMSDNVVYLKFKTPNLEDDARSFLACSHCRNKAFTFILDDIDGFPMVECTCCHQHIGKAGWVDG